MELVNRIKIVFPNLATQPFHRQDSRERCTARRALVSVGSTLVSESGGIYAFQRHLIVKDESAPPVAGRVFVWFLKGQHSEYSPILSNAASGNTKMSHKTFHRDRAVETGKLR